MFVFDGVNRFHNRGVQPTEACMRSSERGQKDSAKLFLHDGRIPKKNDDRFCILPQAALAAHSETQAQTRPTTGHAIQHHVHAREKTLFHIFPHNHTQPTPPCSLSYHTQPPPVTRAALKPLSHLCMSVSLSTVANSSSRLSVAATTPSLHRSRANPCNLFICRLAGTAKSLSPFNASRSMRTL